MLSHSFSSSSLLTACNSDDMTEEPRRLEWTKLKLIETVNITYRYNEELRVIHRGDWQLCYLRIKDSREVNKSIKIESFEPMNKHRHICGFGNILT